MAGTKISALPAATDLTSADIPIVQGGANKKAASTLFATAAQGEKADTALQPADIGSSVQAYAASASQAEMEAGVEAGLRAMSPLRVAQAISALATWNGDVADIDLDGATDISADLADADLILVDDGASGTNRKSVLSRVWTYISGKLGAANQQIATIELGHATDTTLSRLSAGVAGLEGKPIQVVDYAELGAQTTAALTLTENAEVVRTLALTASCLLTITPAGSGKYGRGMVALTGNGTAELTFAVSSGTLYLLGFSAPVIPVGTQMWVVTVHSLGTDILLTMNYALPAP